MSHKYDVFISYNNKNRAQVLPVVEALKASGLRPWLYDWEQRPGQRWISDLQKAIQECRGVAVFIGIEGLGAWQSPELEAFMLRAMQDRSTPLIPVLLPGVPATPALDDFLRLFTWVDLRDEPVNQAVQQLIWGITGTKPEDQPQVPPIRIPVGPIVSNTKRKYLGLAAVAVVLLLAVFSLGFSFFSKLRPELYTLRVQVVDSQGRPARTSQLKLSVSGDIQSRDDGWWVVEIPRVKVPDDGMITVWVESALWSPAQRQVVLDQDPNPSITIQMNVERVRVFGRVVDQSGRPQEATTIALIDIQQASVKTDEQGRFSFSIAKPASEKIRLRAEDAVGAMTEDYCYVEKACEFVWLDD